MYILTVTDLYLKPLGKSVNNRCTDTVETAGDLISAAAELTAGMKHRKDNLKSRLSRCVSTCRDSSSVIGYADYVSLPDFYRNAGAMTGKSLVY